jgi:hypothetical protein
MELDDQAAMGGRRLQRVKEAQGEQLARDFVARVPRYKCNCSGRTLRQDGSKRTALHVSVDCEYTLKNEGAGCRG